MAVVRIDHLNQRFTKAKGEDKPENIMMKIEIKIGIDQTVEIGECHVEVDLSMDIPIEEGHSMIKIIEVTLGDDILEGHKIMEIRILEVYTEVILGMTTLEEVDIGLEIDSNQDIL